MALPKTQHLPPKILAFLEKEGECSAGKILQGVGKEIPDALAIKLGRTCIIYERNIAKTNRNPIPDSKILAQRGRRVKINRALASLVRDGKIVRVRKGVYAPLTGERNGAASSEVSQKIPPQPLDGSTRSGERGRVVLPPSAPDSQREESLSSNLDYPNRQLRTPERMEERSEKEGENNGNPPSGNTVKGVELPDIPP